MGKGDHYHDLEAGVFRPPPPVGSGAGACPAPAYMMESPELRWAFIRKVYALVAMQLLATAAVASVVYFLPVIRRFFAARSPASLAAFVAIIVAPIIRIIIIEAASLTLVVVVGLTLYTFWAARSGHDFTFLGPFLVAACLVLMLYGLAQMLLPMGSAGTTVYGCVAALVFSGFITYDTGNLIKHHGYDEYVTAAISLYLDTVNIFMAMLTCLSSDP
nr:unnamed protein product [Digitaria exilis]